MKENMNPSVFDTIVTAIKENPVTAFVGMNGCGKSTLMHAIREDIKTKHALNIHTIFPPLGYYMPNYTVHYIADFFQRAQIPCIYTKATSWVALVLDCIYKRSQFSFGDNDYYYFFIDNIERDLHPLVQRHLMTWIIEKITDTNIRVILSTHSPYIIDALDTLGPQTVWCLHRTPENITHAKPLSEHPDVEWACKILTLGEFLSAEQEEWVYKVTGRGTGYTRTDANGTI